MLEIKQEQVFWKEYLESLDKKLILAENLQKEDPDLSMLIPLLIVDGLSDILYPKIDCWNRFNKLLEENTENSFLKNKNNRKYLYKTYRCILAHGNLLVPSFRKWWGSDKSPAELGHTKNNHITISIPTQFIIEETKNIIKNLRKTHSDHDDYFEVTIYCCSECHKEFLDNGNSKKKCIFCNSNP